eukprot:scaffold843_cov327-Prasinococcus_capsulatus_cf.AAC.12
MQASLVLSQCRSSTCFRSSQASSLSLVAGESCCDSSSAAARTLACSSSAEACRGVWAPEHTTRKSNSYCLAARLAEAVVACTSTTHLPSPSRRLALTTRWLQWMYGMRPKRRA